MEIIKYRDGDCVSAILEEQAKKGKPFVLVSEDEKYATLEGSYDLKGAYTALQKEYRVIKHDFNIGRYFFDIERKNKWLVDAYEVEWHRKQKHVNQYKLTCVSRTQRYLAYSKIYFEEDIEDGLNEGIISVVLNEKSSGGCMFFPEAFVTMEDFVNDWFEDKDVKIHEIIQFGNGHVKVNFQLSK